MRLTSTVCSIPVLSHPSHRCIPTLEFSRQIMHGIVMPFTYFKLALDQGVADAFSKFTNPGRRGDEGKRCRPRLMAFASQIGNGWFMPTLSAGPVTLSFAEPSAASRSFLSQAQEIGRFGSLACFGGSLMQTAGLSNIVTMKSLHTLIF